LLYEFAKSGQHELACFSHLFRGNQMKGVQEYSCCGFGGLSGCGKGGLKFGLSH
jgi:hypothetical protein